MKTQFIRINDISEINTSKISVHDLNNRYIDKNGKMYGLKYNRKERKVSIIQIIRTPSKTADYYNQLLITGRRDERRNSKPDKETVAPNKPDVYDEKEFNSALFINEVIVQMQTHRQRLEGIMMNINNSRVISERDRSESSQLNDIFRNIEIEGTQRIDRALAYYKELKQHPRSISFYISRFDTKSRKIIDDLDSDVRKLTYIYTAEMYHTIRTLYRTLIKILADLQYFLNKFNIEDIRDLSSVERQYFNDAKVSIDSTTSEINNLLERSNRLEKYIENAKNF